MARQDIAAAVSAFRHFCAEARRWIDWATAAALQHPCLQLPPARRGEQPLPELRPEAIDPLPDGGLTKCLAEAGDRAASEAEGLGFRHASMACRELARRLLASGQWPVFLADNVSEVRQVEGRLSRVALELTRLDEAPTMAWREFAAEWCSNPSDPDRIQTFRLACKRVSTVAVRLREPPEVSSSFQKLALALKPGVMGLAAAAPNSSSVHPLYGACFVLVPRIEELLSASENVLADSKPETRDRPSLDERATQLDERRADAPTAGIPVRRTDVRRIEAAQRQQDLLELLPTMGDMRQPPSKKELADSLNRSERTIGRDLAELAKQGRVQGRRRTD